MVKSKFHVNIWFSSYDLFCFVKNRMHEVKDELNVVGQLDITTLAYMHATSVYP